MSVGSGVKLIVSWQLASAASYPAEEPMLARQSAPGNRTCSWRAATVDPMHALRAE
jgi:hypothetical protein